MNDFEKLIKKMAEQAMEIAGQVGENNDEIKIDFNKDFKTPSKEEIEKIEELTGTLFGGILGDLFSIVVESDNPFESKLDEDVETPVIKIKVENNPNFRKEKATNKESKLSERLLHIKEVRGCLPLDALNKDTLTELLANEKLSVKEVATLFNIDDGVVEYAVMTHKVVVPKEEDLLDKTLLQAFNLTPSPLASYFNSRIDSILTIEDDRLRKILVKEFIVGLSEVFFNLGMTIIPNQLTLVKKDTNDLIYIYIYNLSVDEFLKEYDLLKINWFLG